MRREEEGIEQIFVLGISFLKGSRKVKLIFGGLFVIIMQSIH